MEGETPAHDIRNAQMILTPIIEAAARQAAAMDGMDYETVDALNAVNRRLQDALNKLERNQNEPELKMCSRCKENTEFYHADGWYSVCCDARPIQVDVEQDQLEGA